MPSTLRPALSVSGSQDETAAGAEMRAIGASVIAGSESTRTLRLPEQSSLSCMLQIAFGFRCMLSPIRNVDKSESAMISSLASAQ